MGWDADMDRIFQGIKELFTNQFDAAEMTLKEGTLVVPAIGERDLRGAFALTYALVSVMKGVATFADDQLKECEERLKVADALASKDVNWIGKKVVRGICTITIGVIQLLAGSWAAGLYNIMKSWSWINSLKTEGLSYDGKEKVIIRSTSLFTLGSFYLLLGLLPSSKATSAVLWLSGFHGDREEGLAMIRTAWEEKGLMAPWAGLSLVSYYVDTKTFLGEPLSEQERELTAEIINWAKKMYPGSLFFCGLEADFVSVVQRDVVKAKQVNEEYADEMGRLPALKWVLNYKRGVYDMCEEKWEYAGDHFINSMQVYIEIGRRSMVPFMSAYAMLCYLECKNEGKALKCIEMLVKYKAMKKTDWGRQDNFGFVILERYKDYKLGSSNAAPDQWPFLDLLEVMIFQIRCTYWIPFKQLNAFSAKLLDSSKNRLVTADENVRVFMCCAELARQTGNHTTTMQFCNNAMSIESKLSKEAVKYGAIPMICYTAAQSSYDQNNTGATQLYLKRMKSYGSKFTLHLPLLFKSVVLENAVKTVVVVEFSQLNIPPGAKRTLKLQLEVGVTANWSWLIKKRNISFTAVFQPAAKEEQVLQSFDMHEADAVETLGSFCAPEKGVLALTWNNSFSFLRSKTIMYRISPTEKLTIT